MRRIRVTPHSTLLPNIHSSLQRFLSRVQMLRQPPNNTSTTCSIFRRPGCPVRGLCDGLSSLGYLHIRQRRSLVMLEVHSLSSSCCSFISRRLSSASLGHGEPSSPAHLTGCNEKEESRFWWTLGFRGWFTPGLSSLMELPCRGLSVGLGIPVWQYVSLDSVSSLADLGFVTSWLPFHVQCKSILSNEVN